MFGGKKAGPDMSLLFDIKGQARNIVCVIRFCKGMRNVYCLPGLCNVLWKVYLESFT